MNLVDRICMDGNWIVLIHYHKLWCFEHNVLCSSVVIMFLDTTHHLGVLCFLSSVCFRYYHLFPIIGFPSHPNTFINGYISPNSTQAWDLLTILPLEGGDEGYHIFKFPIYYETWERFCHLEKRLKYVPFHLLLTSKPSRPIYSITSSLHPL